MPVHDWTRVQAGMFHDFHQAWITELRNALNDGLLPDDYYALAEQQASDKIPDLLTLMDSRWGSEENPDELPGALAAIMSPPKVSVSAKLEQQIYVWKQGRLAIHHSSDDRVVAFIEILSSGNKQSSAEFDRFLEKVTDAVYRGCNLLLVDLYPPTSRDPQGIHGAIWGELGDENYLAPQEKRLTQAAYVAHLPWEAYVEPFAVGETLTDMPLFLTPKLYVNVPLEKTYLAAYRGVPKRWKEELDPTLTRESNGNS